jgi:hypothetical protein
MKKTINSILNRFSATIQDADFDDFIEKIRLNIQGNPELDYDQSQLLTLWINKKKNPQDLTTEFALQIADWINTFVIGIFEPEFDIEELDIAA